MSPEEETFRRKANKTIANLKEDIKKLSEQLRLKDDLLTQAMEVACQQSQQLSVTAALQDTAVWDPLSSLRPSSYSTPNNGNRSSWVDVVVRGKRKSAEDTALAPTGSVHNRFAALADEVTYPPLQAAPVADTLDPTSPTRAGDGREKRQDSTRTAEPSSRRRLLKEAVIRRSGGLPRPAQARSPPHTASGVKRFGGLPRPAQARSPQNALAAADHNQQQPQRPSMPLSCPDVTAISPGRSQQNTAAAFHRALRGQAAADAGREGTYQSDTARPLSHFSPLSSKSDTSVHPTTTPQPLFSPTTLLVGDSIIRHIKFFNVSTHCFPGATVRTLLTKLPGLIQAAAPTITRVIIHIGTNDAARQQSELTKQDFKSLFNFLSICGKLVFISGPIPSIGRGDGRFSRILSLHTWLQHNSTARNFGFIDNFNLFWSCPAFFNSDGIHPNRLGCRFLTDNIRHAVQTHPQD